VGDAAALGDVRALQRLLYVVYRRGRHPAGEALDPLVGGARAQRGVEHLRDAIAVPEPRLEGGELRVGRPLGPAERLGEDAPELFLVAHDEDPAVLRSVELARREARMRRARRA